MVALEEKSPKTLCCWDDVQNVIHPTVAEIFTDKLPFIEALKELQKNKITNKILNFHLDAFY